jgi:hypothetical protein
MTLRNRIIRTIIQWLWARYQHQFRDIMGDYHIHKNPTKKKGEGSNE